MDLLELEVDLPPFTRALRIIEANLLTLREPRGLRKRIYPHFREPWGLWNWVYSIYESLKDCGSESTPFTRALKIVEADLLHLREPWEWWRRIYSTYKSLDDCGSRSIPFTRAWEWRKRIYSTYRSLEDCWSGSIPFTRALRIEEADLPYLREP